MIIFKDDQWRSSQTIAAIVCRDKISALITMFTFCSSLGCDRCGRNYGPRRSLGWKNRKNHQLLSYKNGSH